MAGTTTRKSRTGLTIVLAALAIIAVPATALLADLRSPRALFLFSPRGYSTGFATPVPLVAGYLKATSTCAKTSTRRIRLPA
jgi:hypothetical protein